MGPAGPPQILEILKKSYIINGSFWAIFYITTIMDKNFEKNTKNHFLSSLNVESRPSLLPSPLIQCCINWENLKAQLTTLTHGEGLVLQNSHKFMSMNVWKFYYKYCFGLLLKSSLFLFLTRFMSWKCPESIREVACYHF